MNEDVPDLGKIIASKKAAAEANTSAATPLNAALAALRAGEIPHGAKVYVAIGWDLVDEKTGKKGFRLWRSNMNTANIVDIVGLLEIHKLSVLTGTL